MSFHDDKASELLKLATAKKKVGDWEAAITALKQSYDEMKLGDLSYGVEPYLRLPQFLHLAGRTTESWQEFNRLLFQGYPGQNTTAEIRPMERERIFDKMRLFLQREGRYKEAAYFAIFANVSWAIGLSLQSRIKGMQDWFDEDSVLKMVAELRTFNGGGSIQELCTAIATEFEAYPVVDCVRLAQRFDTVLKTRS